MSPFFTLPTLKWVGGRVGGWVDDRKVEEIEAVGMRCCRGEEGGLRVKSWILKGKVDGWVNGWVSG